MCISWTIKGLVLPVHGAIMKLFVNIFMIVTFHVITRCISESNSRQGTVVIHKQDTAELCNSQRK